MKNLKITLLLVGLFLFPIIGLANDVIKDDPEQNISETEFQTRRLEMVEKQIRKRGIRDRVILDSFRKVPRHRFVPEDLKYLAYNDHPLPIGEAQTISQPYIVAFMTEALNLSRSDKILEIGTGSGYQAAILGELCDSVFTIEIIASLGNRAKLLLEELDYQNIKVKICQFLLQHICYLLNLQKQTHVLQHPQYYLILMKTNHQLFLVSYI